MHKAKIYYFERLQIFPFILFIDYQISFPLVIQVITALVFKTHISMSKPMEQFFFVILYLGTSATETKGTMLTHSAQQFSFISAMRKRHSFNYRLCDRVIVYSIYYC